MVTTVIEQLIESVRRGHDSPYKKDLMAALSQAALGYHAHNKCVPPASNTSGAPINTMGHRPKHIPNGGHPDAVVDYLDCSD